MTLAVSFWRQQVGSTPIERSEYVGLAEIALNMAVLALLISFGALAIAAGRDSMGPASDAYSSRGDSKASHASNTPQELNLSSRDDKDSRTSNGPAKPTE